MVIRANIQETSDKTKSYIFVIKQGTLVKHF